MRAVMRAVNARRYAMIVQFATYCGRLTNDLRAICDVLQTIYERFTCNLRRIAALQTTL